MAESLVGIELDNGGDEFRLAKPPLLVQRVVFACLAPFGRRALR